VRRFRMGGLSGALSQRLRPLAGLIKVTALGSPRASDIFRRSNVQGPMRDAYTTHRTTRMSRWNHYL
jgi:hypothetical protein